MLWRIRAQRLCSQPANVCAVTNLAADEILLTGGTVYEIIPVPDTFDYFVWVEVNPGAASLAIALVPGKVPN